MIDQFIEFTKELFPCISPYVAVKTKEAINQFKQGKEYKFDFFTHTPFDYFSQGDVFDDLPFIRQDTDGELQVYKTKGILLSNTCSADHDSEIIFAPFLQINDLKINKSELVNNTFYRLFYIPGDERYEEYAIDFSLLNTFKKDVLNKRLLSGKTKKEASLNQFGYYFLLCKLTINFMRPEDTEVQSIRRTNAACE